MTISLPEIDFNLFPEVGLISNAPQKVLVISQKTPAGTAIAETLVENIPNDGSENTLFGEDSLLAGMIREFKKVNNITRIDAIPLDDAGGSVKSTGVFTITGPATEGGELTFTIGSQVNFTLTIPVADTDTAITIGDALEAAITARADAIVSAVNVAGVVTLTAKNGGEIGDLIGLGFSGTVAGVSVSLTAMSGGVGNAFVSAVFDLLDNIRYQTIVSHFEYFDSAGALPELESFLNSRFNSENAILDGIAVLAKKGTFSTLLSDVVSADSASIQPVELNDVVRSDRVSPGIFESEQNIAAQYAAIRSLRLTEGANISSIVISTVGSSDNVGGKEIASKPYFNTPFPLLPLIDTQDEFLNTEIQQLRDAGWTAIGNNVGRTSIISGEAPTLFKTFNGVPNTTFKFLNAVDTSSVIREFYFNNAKVRFAQSRLTNGDLVNNRDIVNENAIRAFFIGIFGELQGVLIEAGEAARSFFVNNLVVQLNTTQGLVTVTMSTPIVVQLRRIVVNNTIVLDIN